MRTLMLALVCVTGVSAHAGELERQQAQVERLAKELADTENRLKIKLGTSANEVLFDGKRPFTTRDFDLLGERLNGKGMAQVTVEISAEQVRTDRINSLQGAINTQKTFIKAGESYSGRTDWNHSEDADRIRQIIKKGQQAPAEIASLELELSRIRNGFREFQADVKRFQFDPQNVAQISEAKHRIGMAGQQGHHVMITTLNSSDAIELNNKTKAFNSEADLLDNMKSKAKRMTTIKKGAALVGAAALGAGAVYLATRPADASPRLSPEQPLSSRDVIVPPAAEASR